MYTSLSLNIIPGHIPELVCFDENDQVKDRTKLSNDIDEFKNLLAAKGFSEDPEFARKLEEKQKILKAEVITAMEKAGQLGLQEESPRLYDHLYQNWESFFKDGGDKGQKGKARRESAETMHLKDLYRQRYGLPLIEKPRDHAQEF